MWWQSDKVSRSRFHAGRAYPFHINMDQAQEKSATNLGCIHLRKAPSGAIGRRSGRCRHGIFDSNQRRKN
jgi:hypothetical protein